MSTENITKKSLFIQIHRETVFHMCYHLLIPVVVLKNSGWVFHCVSRQTMVEVIPCDLQDWVRKLMRFSIVRLNTCKWRPELPCKTPAGPEATMLWGDQILWCGKAPSKSPWQPVSHTRRHTCRWVILHVTRALAYKLSQSSRSSQGGSRYCGPEPSHFCCFLSCPTRPVGIIKWYNNDIIK